MFIIHRKQYEPCVLNLRIGVIENKLIFANVLLNYFKMFEDMKRLLGDALNELREQRSKEQN